MTRSVQDAITGFWGSIAGQYEAHAGNVPARDSAELGEWIAAIRALLPAPPADVLDIATGTGFVALIAAGLGHRVTAIDLAQPMLAEARAEAARGKLDVAFRTGDAVAPDFPQQSFDAIVNRHLFWTLRDPAAALAAWKRLLRPGGRVVVIDGFWFEPLRDDKPDEGLFESFYTRDVRKTLPGWRYFDTRPVAALFEQHGFRNVSVIGLDAIHRAAATPPGPEPGYALSAFA
ncbi:MAG: methyltransferase domain-containing protein [Alphaproteobacteria bacterium]|nr:methyltransferase domain-containing protein [Alphaproteobacteria bacterium]MBL6937067.1 methyltransferase domain-containing protein [Alphaproteobacteria bacterium]MBL7096371.1 methyltransferase domain-containing protein [Alphaproteobacteria bacterium]